MWVGMKVSLSFIYLISECRFISEVGEHITIFKMNPKLLESPLM